MKLDVYGRKVEVLRNGGEWICFYLGSDGKKRIAEDIEIPLDLEESDIIEYISDLCHEWFRNENDVVKLI